MSQLNQKLDRFTATILAQATAETERTLQALSQQHGAVYSAAENQVLAETYQFVHSEVARVKTQAGRRVSRHMLDDKKALYRRREEIAADVFDLVEQKLRAYAQTPAYPLRLQALYRDAVAALAGARQLRVYLRAEDLGFAPDLAALSPHLQTEFLKGSFLYGGLIAEAPDLGRRVDASFSAAMGDLSGHFAELFGLSLSDDLSEEHEA
ncbi:MAG: V-type ATP synthase subunit E [Pseudoflavonifractor sp.]